MNYPAYIEYQGVKFKVEARRGVITHQSGEEPGLIKILNDNHVSTAF